MNWKFWKKPENKPKKVNFLEFMQELAKQSGGQVREIPLSQIPQNLPKDDIDNIPQEFNKYYWNNKFALEAGDTIEVVNNKHPFYGQKGIVDAIFSKEQFGVIFPAFPFQGVIVWARDLKVIITHKGKCPVPDAYLKAFDETEKE
jgi:hypothetical protein